MKKYLMFCLLASFLSPAYAEMKIATVNYKKVVDEYWKAKEHRQKMQEEAAKLESQRRDKLDELNKMAAEIRKLLEEANDKSLSEKVREEKAAAANKKREEASLVDKTATQVYSATLQDLKGTEQRKLAEVMEDIKAAVEKYGAENKYDLIINVVEQPTSQTSSVNQVIAFSSSQIKDVSEDVVKKLNEGKNVVSVPTKSSDKK